MTSRRLTRVALYLAYLTIVAGVLLETGVRVSGFAEPHLYDPIYAPFDRTPDIPYVHKPNLVRARARGLAIIDTDALGLRTVSPAERLGPKAPDELRIAVVGDSVTFGEGVPHTDDTFVRVLEDELGRTSGRSRVRAFNFGVSAYSVREMAATLEHRMIAVEPDVVLLALIPNDFTVSRTPGIDHAGYLVHRDDQWLRAPGVRHVLRSVHALYLLRALRVRWEAHDRRRWLPRDEVPESYRYVLRFGEIAASRGIASLVVLLPVPLHRMWGALPSRLTADRVAHLDLSPVIHDLAPEDLAASPFDPHPSPEVHRRIGRALAARLADRR